MRRIVGFCAIAVLLAGGCAREAAARGAGEHPVGTGAAGGALASAAPGIAASVDAPADRSAVRLDLSVSADRSVIEGAMDLRWVNREARPVDRIAFLLYPGLVGGRMDIARCTVDGAAASLGGRPRDAVRAIALPAPLAPGSSVRIALSWKTTVPAIAGGGPLARSDGFASLAWCFPVPLAPGTGSGRPAPFADCLCTEAMSWRARVTMPAGLALVTGASETARAGEDGRTVVDLELDPARDFYLAVGTGLAEQPPRAPNGSGPTIRCFAPPGREAAAAFAMEAAGRAIDIFSRRFGPYPYGAFTVLCGPLASLGIEFPGLTVIGEHIFSLEGILADTPLRALLEATVAHEVAHQWFYNIVGNDQAAEPWLDEAAAQYATRLYYLDRYGAGAAEAYAGSWYARWDRVDRSPTPVGLPASDYSEKEYGAIVYGRGPLFLEALASAMGGDAFDSFLRRYVERYAWRIARGDDFLSTAEEQCGRDLDALFAAWVRP